MPSQARHCEQELSTLAAPWTAWQTLTEPSHVATSLVVVTGPSGRLHAFTIGNRGQVSHSEQSHSGLSAHGQDSSRLAKTAIAPRAYWLRPVRTVGSTHSGLAWMTRSGITSR